MRRKIRNRDYGSINDWDDGGWGSDFWWCNYLRRVDYANLRLIWMYSWDVDRWGSHHRNWDDWSCTRGSNGCGCINDNLVIDIEGALIRASASACTG